MTRFSLSVGGNTVQDMSYVYDANGNMTEALDSDSSLRAYTYDSDGRLISESGGSANDGYAGSNPPMYREQYYECRRHLFPEGEVMQPRDRQIGGGGHSLEAQ